MRLLSLLRCDGVELAGRVLLVREVGLEQEDAEVAEASHELAGHAVGRRKLVLLV